MFLLSWDTTLHPGPGATSAINRVELQSETSLCLFTICSTIIAKAIIVEQCFFTNKAENNNWQRQHYRRHTVGTMYIVQCTSTKRSFAHDGAHRLCTYCTNITRQSQALCTVTVYRQSVNLAHGPAYTHSVPIKKSQLVELNESHRGSFEFSKMATEGADQIGIYMSSFQLKKGKIWRTVPTECRQNYIYKDETKLKWKAARMPAK